MIMDRLDLFIFESDDMDLVEIFWRFKSEIEHNPTIKKRINQETNGKIPVTDEELRQIALILKGNVKQDFVDSHD